MDLAYIQNLLQDQYNNVTPVKDFVSTASGNINKQTKKRVRDMNSKFANTGMGRSGISGVALNDIYSNSADSLQSVAAQGENMEQNYRTNLLGQMGSIAQYEDQKPTALDYLGSLLGQAGGVGLGAISGGAGASLATKWF